MTRFPLGLSEMSQPACVINVICYLFLFSFPSFGRLAVYPDEIHPSTASLIKSSGKHCGREKVQRWSIGANEASGYLWVLIISSTPYPPWKAQVIRYLNIYLHSHEGLRNTSTFQDTFPGAAGHSFCLCWCAVLELHGCAAFPSGGRAWGSGHRHLAELHKCTQRTWRRGSKSYKRFWFGPKSLVISLHEEKASALEAYSIYNAQRFQVPAQSRGPPRSRNRSMNYVQNLQGEFTESPTSHDPVYLVVHLFAFRTRRWFCLSSAYPVTADGTNMHKCWHMPFASLWDTRLHFD